MEPDFSRIKQVYDLARDREVSFTMDFSESDSSFNFAIISAAPSECFLGRNHSYDIAVDLVINWLKTL